MTNLTPEQMMADVKRLRAALLDIDGCPIALDEATIPKGKAPNDPTNPPYQVVCNMSISYTRIEVMREALAATDRPEYREEG